MVQILMSTYNGEQYIREQLDSLLQQTYPDIRICVRDDGSADDTIKILEEYSLKYDTIEYYCGENVGVQHSFYDLFKHVDPRADFIATCDQDDVWHPEKVEAAVSELKKIEGIGLYCSRAQLTDAELNPISDNLRKKPPRIAFGNALIENICTGCTMVINRELYDFVEGKWPEKSLIHDWWFYIVAVAFGTVIYDEKSYISYRQHGNNVIGLDNNRFGLLKRQLRSFRKFMGTYTLQMQELNETFVLQSENKQLIDLLIGTRTSWKNRFKVLFDKRIFRQGKMDTILFKGMLFLGML